MKDILLDETVDIKDLRIEEKGPVDWWDDPSVLLTPRRLEETYRYLDVMVRPQVGVYLNVLRELLSLRTDLELRVKGIMAGHSIDDMQRRFLVSAYEEWLDSDRYKALRRTTNPEQESNSIIMARQAIALRTMFGKELVPNPIVSDYSISRLQRVVQSISVHSLAEQSDSAFWQDLYARAFFPEDYDKVVIPRDPILRSIEKEYGGLMGTIKNLAMIRVLYPDWANYCQDILKERAEELVPYLNSHLISSTPGHFVGIIADVQMILAKEVIVDSQGIKVVMGKGNSLKTDEPGLPQVRSYL